MSASYRLVQAVLSMAVAAAAMALFLLSLPVEGGAIESQACALALDPALGEWLLVDDAHGLADKLFPPGSSIKPFTTIAALESGADASMAIRCGPSDPETPARRSCWYRPGHGTVNMEKALAVSCDRYFIELSRSVDWPHFLTVLQNFGLLTPGARAELENIPAEERLDVMTGLSARLRVSPKSLLKAYAAIFNGGYLFGEGDSGRMFIRRRVAVDESAVRVLRAGMDGATRYGTAALIGRRYGQMGILSKTGTGIYTDGPLVDRNRTHGWYAGLAPARSPRAALVVFVREGVGSHDAAPAALKFWGKAELLGNL